MSVYSSIGIMGVGFYLLSYALLQARVIHGTGYAYVLLNLAASSCVLISLVDAFNLSSLLIQIFWIGISVYAIVRLWMRSSVRSRHLGLGRAEQRFVAAALPRLSTACAQRVVELGRWQTLFPGDVLTVEGAQVDCLHYLDQGGALVMERDVPIAELVPGDLAGEITVQSGAPATATVVVSRASRVFSVPAPEMRALLAECPARSDMFELGLLAAMRRKLARPSLPGAVRRSEILRNPQPG